MKIAAAACESTLKEKKAKHVRLDFPEVKSFPSSPAFHVTDANLRAAQPTDKGLRAEGMAHLAVDDDVQADEVTPAVLTEGTAESMLTKRHHGGGQGCLSKKSQRWKAPKGFGVCGNAWFQHSFT